MDFTYFYKRKIFSLEKLSEHADYDLFISCYSNSERILRVIECVKASKKHLLILPDYNEDEIKVSYDYGHKISIEGEESEELVGYFENAGIRNGLNICIDITGFFIPHLLFLIKYFQINGITNFDAIYTEPNAYIEKEQTRFSNHFHKVRQIQGYEGRHVPDTSNDILIIGSGYDDSRITDVANDKAKARKVQLFGFPSLQPDMYQENVIKAYKAEAAVGGESFIDPSNNIYAPANDPFVAAQQIKEFIIKENNKKSITNLYFSPISTKAHALGMAICFLWHEEIPTSIIFPFCQQYYTDTTTGIGKVIIYTVELPKSE